MKLKKIQFRKISDLTYKQKLVILLAILCMALLLAGREYIKSQTEEQSLATREVVEDAASSIANAHQAAADQEYSDSIEILKVYINKEEDQAQKYEASLVLGNYLVLADQPKESLAVYQEAEKTAEDKDDPRLLFGIGQSAEFSGDNKTALSYYKKLLKILDATKPKDEEESFFHADIRQRVAELEEGSA